MEREQVKNILLFYRDIDGEIKHNERLIRDYENHYYTMGGGTLNESYINSRNKVSKPTEKIALNVPVFVSADISCLQGENESLCKLKSAILQEFNKLPLPQKTILYDFYIQGLKWVQLSVRNHYSERQGRNIRNRALDNLAKLFDKNKLIKNFNYPF